MPNLKLSSLFPHPDNPRTDCTDSDLKDSIASNGLLTPILVREFGFETFQVLSGHRRLAALKALGWPTAACHVIRADDAQANFILLEANLQQRSLEPAEEARAIAKRMQKFGLTQAKLAQEYGRTQQWVSLRLALLPQEEKPVREDGKGRPSFTNRVVNTPPPPAATAGSPAPTTPVPPPPPPVAPTVAREIYSAPAAAQSAVAKAVEEKKLTTRQTAELVEAVKAAPPKRQAEVAQVAAQSDNPVAVAKTLASSLQKSDPEPEKPLLPARHLYFGSHLESLAKTLSAFEDRWTKFMLLNHQNRHDDAEHRLDYSLCPDIQRVRDFEESYSYLINELQRHLDLVRAEVKRRETSANVVQLRVVGAAS